MAIQILPSEVVDQIAAGEVVERPAHLVKELVENSIDAGASEIEVEFDHGGRFVKVKDDGVGISEKELGLSLARHATSKISLSSDLWELSSFGFRGEALASIAAVCRLTLISQPRNQNQAYQIKSLFGELSTKEPVGGSAGTTVIIEDLFSNVPARLKFLKSDGAEGTQIKNVLKALAMAHPEVTFRVRHKSKLLYYWPATDNRKSRVEQVLEQDNLFEGMGESNGVQAYAVMSAPNHTFKNSRQMWFFAQNRWVQDRSFMSAVMDAYRNLLMHGEFPLVTVWVTCDPEDIDVNIHPTKSQVKFKTPSDAFRAVNRAIRQTLERAPWIEALQAVSLISMQDPEEKTSQKEKLESKIQREEFFPLQFQDPSFQKTQLKKKEDASTKTELFAYTPQSNKIELPEEGMMETLKKYSIRPKGDYKTLEKAYWSHLQVLGQAHLTYIVAQSDKAIMFVDQHAAHERVVFESLMESWRKGSFEVQPFLMPLTMDLEVEEAEALLNLKDEFSKMGVEIDSMGPQSIGIRSAPSMIKESSLTTALNQVAKDVVEKGGSFAFEKAIGDIFATMACHSVVRAGQALSHQEMKSLLQQMDEYPLSSFCPHGRPVYVEYEFQKLERDFGRLV